MIEVPVADIDGGHGPLNLNVNLKSRALGRVLRRVRLGLENANAKLADGTIVTDYAKTVRWLLEQVDRSTTKKENNS